MKKKKHFFKQLTEINNKNTKPLDLFSAPHNAINLFNYIINLEKISSV